MAIHLNPLRKVSHEQRFQVGEQVHEQELGDEEPEVTFELPLEKRDYTVRAELLDAEQKVIAGAYYVYCKKVGEAK